MEPSESTMEKETVDPEEEARIRARMARLAAAVALVGTDAPTIYQQRARNLDLRVDKDGNFHGFGDYMHAKVNKLKQQVHSNVIKKSDLFKGLSFYVDGMTHPPALVLRERITENGGEYHHYYRHGVTTFVVAENLANTKIERVRKEEQVIHPNFINDSLNARKLQPVTSYLLVNRGNAKDAANNQYKRFFDKSRLHLISTMATTLKRFVADMKKNKDEHAFTGRERLAHLRNSSNSLTVPVICHIDMDCFFVSVALRTRPHLNGKPVAVTHSSTSGPAYGEIASCSYEARAKGCRAGMYVRDALKRCPDLQTVPYEFDNYVQVSKELYTIISNYTLQVKAISCDELYFDLGSICNELGISNPLTVIEVIRAEILEKTGCSASAGLGPNSLVARMATKRAKPNGQYYVTQEEAIEFIGKAAISDLPSIGYNKFEEIQGRFGPDMKLCHQLFAYSMEDLRKVLGASISAKVYQALRGKCEAMDFDANDEVDQKSVSVNVNFGIRFKDMADVKECMKSVSEELSERLENINKMGTKLSLKLLIRLPDAPKIPAKYGAHGPCNAVRKTKSIPQTANVDVINNAAMKMYNEINPDLTDVRGVALHMTNLITFAPEHLQRNPTKGQGTLFDYMKTKKVTKGADGTTHTNVTEFEWAPKVVAPKPRKNAAMEPFAILEEQDEMRMRIADTVKMVPYRPIPARKLGKLPPAPERIDPSRILYREKRVSSYNRRGERIDKLLLESYSLPFERKMRLKDYHRFLYYCKQHVKGFLLSQLKECFENWELLVSKSAEYQEWKKHLQMSKHYLNMYCFNLHGGKIWLLKELNDEEIDRCVWDIAAEMAPKRRRSPSPDLFDPEKGIFAENIPDADEEEENAKNVAPSSSQETIYVENGSNESVIIEDVSGPCASTSRKRRSAAAEEQEDGEVSKPKSKPSEADKTKKNAKNFKKQKSFNDKLKKKQPVLDGFLKPVVPAFKKRKPVPNVINVEDIDDDDECLIIE